VAGHVLPVTRRFRGGRGVATSAGVVLVLFPPLGLVAGALWLVLARVVGRASVASLVAVVAVPVMVVVTGRPGWETAGVAGLAVLVVARHAPNLARLVRGEERSLRSGGAPGA
jgi:acyl phosphate:glycerol-3-phosphate acyltransferase